MYSGSESRDWFRFTCSELRSCARETVVICRRVSASVRSARMGRREYRRIIRLYGGRESREWGFGGPGNRATLQSGVQGTRLDARSTAADERSCGRRQAAAPWAWGGESLKLMNGINPYRRGAPLFIRVERLTLRRRHLRSSTDGFADLWPATVESDKSIRRPALETKTTGV